MAVEILTQRERLMSSDDAALLRHYKKFLTRLNLKEGLYCRSCEERNDHPGVRAVVTDGKIDIQCRCTTRRYRGQSY